MGCFSVRFQVKWGMRRDILRFSCLFVNLCLLACHPGSHNAKLKSRSCLFSKPATNVSKIALLLPRSTVAGNQASAEAVKHGFLTAYYQHLHQSKQPISVKLYDAAVIPAYDQAIDDGAEVIVGPLLKEDLATLVHHADGRVPILALNRLPPGNYGKSQLLQFALAPEEEAAFVAQRIQQQQLQRAIIIARDNTYGHRLAKAFREAYQQDGFTVVDTVYIQTKTNLNATISKILGIDLHKKHWKQQAAARVKQLPIDVMFLALPADLARQIKPLLNFYYAEHLPVYATSYLYSGQPNPALDQDLEGITFCDMPWILDESIHQQEIYQTIHKLWAKALASNARLFALGVDAYRLSQQLQQLSVMPDAGVPALTGRLHLEAAGILRRELLWAHFKHGRAVLLQAALLQDDE